MPSQNSPQSPDYLPWFHHENEPIMVSQTHEITQALQQYGRDKPTQAEIQAQLNDGTGQLELQFTTTFLQKLMACEYHGWNREKVFEIEKYHP
jgi:hypothetical protein